MWAVLGLWWVPVPSLLPLSLCCFVPRAGLKAGDVLLEINGQPSSRAEDVYKAVRTEPHLALLVRRGSESLRLTITPEVTD